MSAAIERARWKEGALQVCLPVAARAARVAAAATSTSKLTPWGSWASFDGLHVVLRHWLDIRASRRRATGPLVTSPPRALRRLAGRYDHAAFEPQGGRARVSSSTADTCLRSSVPPNPRCDRRVPSRGLLATCDPIPSLEESGERLGCHCQPAAEALADLGARRSGRSRAGFCERAKAHMPD